MADEKWCSKCAMSRPIADFYTRRSGTRAGQAVPYCRECLRKLRESTRIAVCPSCGGAMSRKTLQRGGMVCESCRNTYYRRHEAVYVGGAGTRPYG